MFLDALLKLSAAQQVTADAATTNSVDGGNVTPKRDLAEGEPMGILISITAIGTNTGSAQFRAVNSANADLSSPEVIGAIDLATADIAVGRQFVVALSKGNPALRYWGGHFDITGTVDFTVDVYFGPMKTLQAGKPQTYAKGYTGPA